MLSNPNISKPRVSGRRLVLGGLIAILGLGWAGAQASDKPAGLEPLAQTSEAAATAPKNRSNDSSCVQCHRFEPVLTHPVNVRASMRTPETLPLQGGMLVCSTCHDASAGHAQTHSRVGVRWEGDAAGGCVQCHQGAAPGSKVSHALAVGKVHLAREGAGKLLATSAGLDAQSTSCMGCHDGTVAALAGSHATGRVSAEGATDHPVGVSMGGLRRKSGSDFKLADAGSLDRRIRLAGGNVSCGSCHSAYSTERAQLVMNNEGSVLCLNCHKQ